MKVLVVEDEAAIRESEIAFLHQAGYDTSEAADGKEAIEKFEKVNPDVMVLDLNLPKLSGIEVCRQIRNHSMVPIIVVTARDSFDDEVRSLEMGADDFIRKPFNAAVLIARVNKLLHRHHQGRLTRGSLTIDPQQLLVLKDNKPISLTTTQFNILYALAQTPGVVLTRQQLIDRGYSDPTEHDIYDRTIDAHIKSIRKAIEDDPNHPHYVCTMIGKGYAFRGDNG